MINIYAGGTSSKVVLKDVHVTPGLRKNLLSIGQLMDRGIHTSSTKQGALLWKLTDDGIQQTVGSATWYDGLCYLDGHAEKGAIACVAEKPKDTLINWHARLGHVNYDDVTLMENYGLADGVHISDKSRNTLVPAVRANKHEVARHRLTPHDRHQRMR